MEDILQKSYGLSIFFSVLVDSAAMEVEQTRSSLITARSRKLAVPVGRQ